MSYSFTLFPGFTWFTKPTQTAGHGRNADANNPGLRVPSSCGNIAHVILHRSGRLFPDTVQDIGTAQKVTGSKIAVKIT
jgi:hypothetical protein